MKISHRVNDCGIANTTSGSNALDREFEYDPLNRLTSATGRESNTQNQNDYLYADAPAPGTPNANNVQAYTRKYQYDKMGNVLQVKQQGSNGFTRKFRYFTDVNTLEKISDVNDILIEDFTYDDCGNQLTAGASRHYIWTAANRLLVYKNQTGSSDPTIFAQYDYDGAGNRVSKLVRTGGSSPTFTRTIYIDGIFEYHILENGTTYEKNYVHVMDASAGSAQASRIAMVRVGDQFPDDISESIIYNLENQIKSSSARLDTNGTVIDREEYYPFGDSSLRTFSKKRFRYVGKEKDLESGLYYYGARYYSAWTCRFISVDPLGKTYNQLSPYQNAGNNPINDRDIDGNQGENSSKAKDTKYDPGEADNMTQQPDALQTRVPNILGTLGGQQQNGNSEGAKSLDSSNPIINPLLDGVEQVGEVAGKVGERITQEATKQMEYVREPHIKVGTNSEIYISKKNSSGIYSNKGNQSFTTTNVDGVKQLGLNRLKFIGQGLEAIPLVSSAFDLASLISSKGADPFVLLPTSFLTDIHTEKMNADIKDIFSKSVESGYESAKSMIANKVVQRTIPGLEMREMDATTFKNVMEGNITSVNQLTASIYSSANATKEKGFAVLYQVDQKSKEGMFSVVAGYNLR